MALSDFFRRPETDDEKLEEKDSKGKRNGKHGKKEEDLNAEEYQPRKFTTTGEPYLPGERSSIAAQVAKGEATKPQNKFASPYSRNGEGDMSDEKLLSDEELVARFLKNYNGAPKMLEGCLLTVLYEYTKPPKIAGQQPETHHVTLRTLFHIAFRQYLAGEGECARRYTRGNNGSPAFDWPLFLEDVSVPITAGAEKQIFKRAAYTVSLIDGKLSDVQLIENPEVNRYFVEQFDQEVIGRAKAATDEFEKSQQLKRDERSHYGFGLPQNPQGNAQTQPQTSLEQAKDLVEFMNAYNAYKAYNASVAANGNAVPATPQAPATPVNQPADQAATPAAPPAPDSSTPAPTPAQPAPVGNQGGDKKSDLMGQLYNAGVSTRRVNALFNAVDNKWLLELYGAIGINSLVQLVRSVNLSQIVEVAQEDDVDLLKWIHGNRGVDAMITLFTTPDPVVPAPAPAPGAPAPASQSNPNPNPNPGSQA